ncbi:glycosyltransferase family 2 protein [Microcella alkaliphila]|uniref:Glycosyltransferase, group 2 family protein n=1 Tax=Microcella alkaliphila TaxID=279828 RepID=A0A0U5BNM1_9MICO|nr:glycosyltransferase family 2 protein [Microcella alkaliphila]BAU33141.1 glycosyltransferase, group 2 family protein [Microcella alkaliphila]
MGAAENEHGDAATLAVVTVAYRSDEVLPTFLRSIPPASSEPVTVVVVDNAPTAGDARSHAEECGAQYLALAANPGYGGAVNAAVKTLPASVEWILVSNPDVVLGAGAIDELLAAARASDRVGSAGPTVLGGDGALYPSARSVPSIRTGVGHALFGRVWPSNPWSARYLGTRRASDGTADVGWLSGSCVLVRRAAFDEVGGFDEGYFMYFEDVDLGFRLGRAGYVNRFVPGAVVTHTGAHSTSGDESARMIQAHHDSAKRFLAQKYPGRMLAPIRGMLGVGLDIRSAIARRATARRATR